MSVALCFWKYKKGEYLDNDEVCRRASAGETIEELDDLPINDITIELEREFDGWSIEKDVDGIRFNGDDAGVFVLMSTSQFVRADCTDMGYEDMNSIIDVMHDFACPLYDPALPQRFDTDIEI